MTLANITSADVHTATALVHMYSAWAHAWADCAYRNSRHDNAVHARRAKRHAEQSASNAEWFAAQADSAAYVAELNEDWDEWHLIDAAWDAANEAHRVADTPIWLGED